MTAGRVADTLTQMRGATQLARSYVDGMTKEAFVADSRTQQAVIMNLVIIGELATKLLKDHGAFIALHPGIPWSSMRGMRNRVVAGCQTLDVSGTVLDSMQAIFPSDLSG